MNDVAAKINRRRLYALLIVLLLIGALVVRLYLKSIVPPLVHAVRRDNLAEVRRLVEQGAQVRVSCGYAGNSALHNAISTEMIDYLIDVGADINAKNDRGMTPLHLAAMLRTAPVAETLLQQMSIPSMILEKLRYTLRSRISRQTAPRSAEWRTIIHIGQIQVPQFRGSWFDLAPSFASWTGEGILRFSMLARTPGSLRMWCT